MTSRRAGQDVEGRQTVAAGQAIAVVFLALVMAAFLNADSLVASIDGQSFGTSRSIGLALARPVRTISHWTGLNLPRKIIDDVVASHHPLRRAAPVSPRPPRPAPSAGRARATTTTIPPRRTPTAQAPLKVWLAGDSLMGTIAESFIDKTGGNPLFTANADFRIGTGLVRPDVYDWPTAISNEMASANPDVIVLLFGANDDQDMVVGGQRLSLQSPAWQQEYARRVNQILDASANGVRQVIWLGVPAVRRPRLNQTKDYIDSILKAVVPTHPNATYVDTGSLLDGPGNSFSTYRTNATGTATEVRESDGIHITLAGADLVTPVVIADIDLLWHVPA